MASRTPRTPVYETHPQPLLHPNTLPPPPPRSATYSTPPTFDHVSQRPALSVVPIQQGGSHQSTPMSSTSRHSPFSPTVPTPTVGATRSTSRTASPMASRHSGQISVPYDPRDWASGDVRANQAARARLQQAEDGLASPPPPYSPQNVVNQQAERTTPNSSAVGEARPAGIHVVQSHTSPGLPQPPPPHIAHPNQRHSIHQMYQVPPPPPINTAIHTGNPAVIAYRDGSYSREPSPGPTQYAPAARRAVSANAGLPQHYEESGSSSRSGSRSRWQPGMPLPGPPPGPPPPSSSRSQSMTSTRERSASSGMQRPRPLRYTVHESGLGPVPPTPADWVEGAPLPSAAQGHLSGDVRGAQPSTSSRQTQESIGSGSANPSPTALGRSSAVRDPSVKSLRERRAQNRHSRIIDASDITDLSVSTSPNGGVIPSSEPGSARLSTGMSSTGRVPSGRHVTLSPLVGMLVGEGEITASPMTDTLPPVTLPSTGSGRDQGYRSAGLPPKSLPTPPLSHKAPLSAHSTLNSARGSFSTPGLETADDFSHDSIRRHTDFLEREKLAPTDAERLNLFVEYIAHEAAIRQQRYETAITSGEFDINGARHRLFEPLTQRNSLCTVSDPQKSMPQTTPQAISTNQPTSQNRTDSTYWKDYQPALSPIASMDYDEMSSRGRAPSRWWESQTGSQSGGRSGPIQRTKRESKYMGLSKEFLMAHSPSDEAPHGSQYMFSPSAKEFPREKENPTTFGYYNDEDTHPTPTFPSNALATPKLMDISRFITLPPPYPRHYPAVNNNHPELANYRTIVRTLSDLSDIRTRRSRHELSIDALRTDLQRKLTDGRRTFRSNIQAQIQEGSITYAEAAEAEEANKISECELEKQNLQAEFDTLQDVVINPLHDMLNDRIQQLNTNIQQLQDDLTSEARHQDPDQPQEEGDETPELLEKLTQLKWLFDTREQIHRECFELMSERNDKFKSIVLFPYKWSSNTDKVRDTELFFEKDTQTRYLSFCDGSLQRHEAFLEIVDQNVRRGVELQSSAFWDIAPDLLDLLQKLPEDLQDLSMVHIPQKEYEENPSYYQHPQQYLYTLLSHAEKSTYQFIEGQTNLHCLLHEVKTGVLAARYRTMQARAAVTGTHEDDPLASRTHDESLLTAELKQKASMIEQQWLEALGSQLQGTRDRVKIILQAKDAWEEIAEQDA